MGDARTHLHTHTLNNYVDQTGLLAELQLFVLCTLRLESQMVKDGLLKSLSRTLADVSLSLVSQDNRQQASLSMSPHQRRGTFTIREFLESWAWNLWNVLEHPGWDLVVFLFPV